MKYRPYQYTDEHQPQHIGNAPALKNPCEVMPPENEQADDDDDDGCLHNQLIMI